jgi:hypothetical protein
MDRLERYLDNICRSIGGPRSLREHVRRELRGHLLDARDQHRAEGLSDDEALTSALEEFGRPEDLRLELEAAHGHRMLGVAIDRAMQWKERTMRARWLWVSWANLTVGLVITLELLLIAFNGYFILPKFQALVYDGFIDAGSVRHAGNSWMLVFLDRLGTVQENYTWWILLAALVAIGLFEWRVKGENKSLMRLSALGTSALGLFLVVIVMTVSLVVTFCLATPRVGPMVRPWAVEQVASIDAAIEGIEQARVKKDWDAMREQAERESSATERLGRGPAMHSLVGWGASPTLRELQHKVQTTSENIKEVQKAIREKDEDRLRKSLQELGKSYGPVRDLSKRPPAWGR